jgi:hypothetical protein
VESLRELYWDFRRDDEENRTEKRNGWEFPENREHTGTFRCRKKGVVVVIFRGCT